MEELKLKHLYGYLPYELKGIMYYGGCVCENVELGLIDIPVWLNCSYPIKPILRPLSYLTKEIEVNGEKFVPIYKLFEIEYKDTHHVDSIREMYFKVNYTFTCSSHYGTAMGTSINTRYIEMNNFWKIKKLLKWHFDIYGLIEKGLAIDFNTLNKQ